MFEIRAKTDVLGMNMHVLMLPQEVTSFERCTKEDVLGMIRIEIDV